MMTYGWAILIIVIVAGVLYSLGIFNPSASAGATISGFAGFSVPAALCVNTVNNGILGVYLSNLNGYTINITKINLTTSTSKITQVVNSILQPNGAGGFYINGGCNGSATSLSLSITYTEPGRAFPGPYFSTGYITKLSLSSNQNLVANFTNSSYIQTANGYPAETAVTESFWVKFKHFDNALGQYYELTGHDSAATQPCCNWRVGAVLKGIYFDPGYHGDTQASDNGMSKLNNWYFITLVMQNVSGSNDNYWVYVNGTLYLSGTATSTQLGIPAINYLDIGLAPGDPAAINGEVSDVQVYASTLSIAQISQQFLEGPGSAPTSNQNLIGWWPLDGNSNDYSTGGNNGNTLVSISWVSP